MVEENEEVEQVNEEAEQVNEENTENIKSNDKTKWVKIEKNQNHLVDYNGPITKKLEKYFVVDATLPILIDKEPNLKVGDYVTGGIIHGIQAHLVDKEGNNKWKLKKFTQ